MPQNILTALIFTKTTKKQTVMKTIITAANITYGGITQNTPVKVEYKHTGKIYFYGKTGRYTQSAEIAAEWIAKGRRVKERPGYYFISRIAIPTTLSNGRKDWWYITNDGDNYQLNKASKFFRRIHSELSKDQPEQN